MANNTFQGTIPAHVEQIIYQQIGSETELTMDTDLFNELAIDSLELVEVGLKIEKQFGKKLPITELRGCITVGELIQLVEQVNANEQVKNV